MKKIYDIFTKSPFGLIDEHMKKVNECVHYIEPIFNEFINGNIKEAKEIGKEISQKEHEADTIKHQIREHLPKSIFMPVSREDLLKLLHRQDDIADYCEEVGILLSLRKTTVIDEIKNDILAFVKSVVKTASEACEITGKMKELMETSFSGPSAEEVLTGIENVEQLEWETNQKKYYLVKKIFENEEKIDPVSVIMLLKIIDITELISASADGSLNALRLMISK